MRYFKLPDLGEGLMEADIVEWHVAEGDEVQVDQLLVSVETAKAIVEVPSPCAGKILHRFGDEGDTVNIGEPLVEFITDDQSDHVATAGSATDSGTVVGDIPQAQTVTQD
ncbi:MAG: hypothetical protein OIF34_13855, partial [Porticoccaceae bacterium]|nr:hypothetical protein [Porticoccaceae bacterium]